MTGISSTSQYNFNGVISTDKTVMQNLEAMTNAAGSWLTYDIHTGRWSVIINKPGVAKYAFNDDNIIGSISVSGTGLTDLYNAVRVEFPHIDLNDQTDFVQDAIPTIDLNPNEPSNTLVIQYDILNDPIQAELLGLRELKQSRIDKIINFSTDYSMIGVKAGDIISVTNDLYGFDEKLFRVISAAESDADDGLIMVSISAMEYDENIYSTDDLYRYERTNQNGIITPGALAKPGTPELSQFSNISRPYLKMESTITSTDATALVEGVEFWYSQDQSNYYLAGTDRPANDKNYINGEVAELDWFGAPTGNIWVKARSYNSMTTGPFSNVSALLYQPVQIPDAVPVDNADGTQGMWDMLALAAALAALNSMIGTNTDEGSPFGDLLSSGDVVTGLTAGNNITITQSIPGNYTISSTGTGTGDGTWQGASRYVSATQPTGTFVNGDVWFKIP